MLLSVSVIIPTLNEESCGRAWGWIGYNKCKLIPEDADFKTDSSREAWKMASQHVSGLSTGKRLWAALQQRCPRCGRGSVFATSTRMNEACPVCRLRFEREEGYFLGAMYFSYFLAVFILGALYAIVQTLLPEWSAEWTVGIAICIFLPFVPMVFRYSRVIWIHFDRWAWQSQDT